MLAMTYSSFKESTIGAKKLNFRVRNENGCTLLAESPTYKTHYKFQVFFRLTIESQNCFLAYPYFV